MEIKIPPTGRRKLNLEVLENPRSRDPRAHLDLTL